MKIFILFIIIALLGVTTVLLSNLLNKESTTKTTMTMREIAYIVIFSAMAIVVGMFEIPLGTTGAKLDFSEVVILIALYIMGLKNVSFVIILRTLVRLLMPAKTPLEAEFVWKVYGEVIAIVASYVIIGSYLLGNKLLNIKEKPLLKAVPTEHKMISLKEFIVQPLLMTISLVVILTLFHVVVTVPVWEFVFTGSDMFSNKNFIALIKLMVTMFGLLNLFKGLITSIVFLLLKSQIDKIIK